MAISYNTSIVRNGLVLHLDAANVKSYPGSGTAWNDLSGNGNNGTLVNSVGYSTNNKGYLTFDGIDDRIDIPNSVSINQPLASNFSCDIWCYPQIGGNAFGKIFSKTYFGGGKGFQLTYNSSTLRGSFAFQTAANVNTNLGFDLPLNNWYHILLIRDTTVGASVYLNGILVNSSSAITYDMSNDYDLRISVEAQPTSINEYKQQYVSNFKFYNKALSVTEASQNFNALRGRYGI